MGAQISAESNLAKISNLISGSSLLPSIVRFHGVPTTYDVQHPGTPLSAGKKGWQFVLYASYSKPS